MEHSGENVSSTNEGATLAKETVASTLVKLETLWTIAGYTPKKKRELADSVLNEARALYCETIKHAHEEQQRYFDKIDELVSEIRKLSEDLGDEILEDSLLELNGKEKTLRQKVAYLDSIKMKLVEKCNRRSEEIDNLMGTLRNLLNQLGSKELPLELQFKMKLKISEGNERQNTSLHLDVLNELRNQIGIAQTLKEKRQCLIQSLIVEITSLVNDLEEATSENDVENVIRNENGDFSEDLILTCEKRISLLNLEKQMRCEKISLLDAEIRSLWDQLDIDDSHRVEFTRSFNLASTISPVSKSVIDLLENELFRMNQLKKENIESLILRIRNDISVLWHTLRYSEEQKDKFKVYFQSQNFTELLLKAHEDEKRLLNAQLQELQGIFEMIEKRNEYLQLLEEVAATSQDPNKYKSRDSFKILKREEEARAIESKRLPKLEQKLMTDILQWEESHMRPFTVEGLRYINILEKRIEESSKEKKKKSLEERLTPSKKLSREAGAPLRKDASTPSSFSHRMNTPTRKTSTSLTNTPRNLSFSQRINNTSAAKSKITHTSSFLTQSPSRSLSFEVENSIHKSNVKTKRRIQRDNSSVEEVTKLLSQVSEVENSGDLEKAVELCSKGINIATNSDDLSSLHHKRAIIYQRLGKFSKALQDSERALKFDGSLSS